MELEMELEMLKRNVNNAAQSDKAKSLMRERIEQIKTENNDTVQAIALRHLNVGDLIKRKPNAKAVYVINHRNKATKTRLAEYSLSDYEDMNREIFLKEDTIVYTGFTY